MSCEIQCISRQRATFEFSAARIDWLGAPVALTNQRVRIHIVVKRSVRSRGQPRAGVQSTAYKNKTTRGVR